METTESGTQRYGSPVAARFVGRSAELAELVERLEGALAGRASAVLVAGEPGIGKTRLVSELGRLAGAHSVPVLWGRCSDDDGVPAYWPWRSVLRAWQSADPAGPAALARADLADLRRIAPELGAGPPPVGDTGAERRFALFDATARALSAAAERTGLVVVLDDLQWADPDSLALLVHLARDAPAARLLLVATARPAELVADSAREHEVGRLTALPSAVRLDLRGLAAPDVADALTERLGARPAPEVVSEVTARSGGNPFFVVELARVLAERPDGLDGPVPSAVRDVVRARLGRLPGDCRTVLDVAAVVGPEIDEALLGELTGKPVAEVRDVLRPALDDGVLVRPPGRATPAFVHDIVREALLEVLGSAERVGLHERIAAVLAPRADDPDVLPELTRHALAALPLGDPAVAVGWARRAAELALSRLAFAESTRLYARMLEAGRRVLDPGERARGHVDLARAQLRAHAVSDAVASCTTAVDLARHAGDAEALASAALVVQGFSDPELLTAQSRWCAEALAALDPGDSSLRAQLLAQQTHALLYLGPPTDVAEVSRRSLAMAERVGDPNALTAALRARQLACSGPDGVAERIELGDRMLAVGRVHGLGAEAADATMWGHLWRFDALLQAGRVGDAERELARLAPVVASAGLPLGRLHLVRSRAAIAFGRGRFDEVLRLNDEAAQMARRGRHAGAAMTASAVEWQVARLVGRDGLDDRPLASMRDPASPVFAVLGASMASWHLALGRPDEAAHWYRDLPEPGSPRIPRFMSLITEALRVQVAVDLGDDTPLEGSYRFLAPFAGLHVVGGAGATATHGSVQQYLGVAAGALGRTADAVRHLTAAIEADDANGLAPFAATARYRLAVVLRGRGRPGDAEQARLLAERADAVAAQLGMAPLRRHIAELADTLRDGGVLSPRETEVAGLVARGMTNRAIAERLHLSERTVETHVAHVLAKLGFSGRSQIAAWAVRHGH